MNRCISEDKVNDFIFKSKFIFRIILSVSIPDEADVCLVEETDESIVRERFARAGEGFDAGIAVAEGMRRRRGGQRFGRRCRQKKAGGCMGRLRQVARPVGGKVGMGPQGREPAGIKSGIGRGPIGRGRVAGAISGRRRSPAGRGRPLRAPPGSPCGPNGRAMPPGLRDGRRPVRRPLPAGCSRPGAPG